MRIAQEEIFGPTTALIPVEDFDEAVAAANGDRSTGSRRRSSRATSTAPSARCATSQPGSRTSTPARSAPRCTCRSAASKETGNGHREAGQAALDVFTEWKSIYVDYSGTLQKAQIDNA